MGGLRDQREWGPHVWHFLHTLAATYDPEHQRQAVIALLDNLPALLPCSICADHLRETYASAPFDAPSRLKATLSRDALVVWVNRLHNRVSERTGGATFPLYMANVPNTTKAPWVLVFVLVVLLAAALVACK